jgi:hypothetical protein
MDLSSDEHPEKWQSAGGMPTPSCQKKPRICGAFYFNGLPAEA